MKTLTTRWLIGALVLLGLAACASPAQPSAEPGTAVAVTDTPRAPFPTPPVTLDPLMSDYPVDGMVHVENETTALSGPPGTVVTLTVNFIAKSPLGQVTEMRFASVYCVGIPSAMTGDWEPFTPTRTYTIPVTSRKTTFDLTVQYRDEYGFLSETPCLQVTVYPSALGMEPTPTLRPTLEPAQHFIQVDLVLAGADARQPPAAGAQGVLQLVFHPLTRQVLWRQPNGLPASETSGNWPDAPVRQVRYCISANAPCTALGELQPYTSVITTPLSLDWLGPRRYYATVVFFDAAGQPVPAGRDGYYDEPTTAPVTVEAEISPVLSPDIPVAQLPGPVLTAAAATQTAYPVTGQVKLEGSPCCRGGTAGSILNLVVNFTASSPTGPVTEMRIGPGCPTDPSEMTGEWEPFAATRTVQATVFINWQTFYISAQFRDAQGHLSSVYCDTLDLEGSPQP